MPCRRLKSSHSKKTWSALTDTEREVWKQFSWTEGAWAGRDKAPVLVKWKDLDTAQQSAVKYGLKLDETQWNSLVDDKHSLATSSAGKQQSAITASTSKGVKSVATSLAWSAIKVIGPAARAFTGPRSHPALHLAGHLLGHSSTLLDEFADPVIIPAGGMETILYLDDSGSMDDNLFQGKAALDTMSDLLQGNSVRIVKFGAGKTVLSPRDDSFSTALTFLNWDAKSGSTYMWKMIEDDVVQRYRPSPGPTQGKLRLIVITDGFDTDSPGEYRGIKGMDPMMRTLLAKGYNVEFHIVVLGKHRSPSSQQALKRYQNLADATGGGYMALDGLLYSEKNPAVINFVATLEESNDTQGGASLRQKQRQDYLRAAKDGKRENFDWLKLLPPS